MNHKDLVEWMLKEDGATLIRQTRHRVFKLSNGRKYVLPYAHGKQDPRNDMNQLRDLKRALRVDAVETGQQQEEVEVAMKTEEPTLRGRLEKQIEAESAQETKWMALAQEASKRCDLLRHLLKHVDEHTESLLRGVLLGRVEVPAPPPAEPSRSTGKRPRVAADLRQTM